MTHIELMEKAIEMAELALTHGDVPVGAIVVFDGKIVGIGENRREIDADPSAHAEIVALKDAAKIMNNWNLSKCDMYVTLEPCAMCSGAIINARIENLYFGAFDGLYGCCGSIYNLPQDKKFNHNVNVYGGILNEKCKDILVEFFASKRQEYKLY